MKLSIKTKDIEIEYQDDYTKIEEDVKKRITDVIHSLPIIPTQPTTEARTERKDPKNPVLTKDHRVSDPMWISRANNFSGKGASLSKDFVEGYSQAVYQIRLYMSSLEEERIQVNETYKYTEFVLKELYKTRDQQELSSQILNSNRGTGSDKPLTVPTVGE